MIITKTPYRLSLFGGGTAYSDWYSFNKSRIIWNIPQLKILKKAINYIEKNET